jgi:hypothetical protein
MKRRFFRSIPISIHMNKSINRAGIGMAILLIGVIAFETSWRNQKSGAAGRGGGGVDDAVTRYADRAEPDTERGGRSREAISLASQKWYEELLEKYPDMKPVYRDVPDEENGYLQLLQLTERVRELRLPDDMRSLFSGKGSEWDARRVYGWLSENQTYFTEILRVAELSDRSIKGIDFDRVYQGPSRLGSEFSYILQGAARLAFESGDEETALRYMKAAGGIGDHLTDIEVPSMMGEVISTGIRSGVRESFRENFLPSLANDPKALRQWEEAIFRSEKPASEYARIVAGEWNTVIRSLLLPAFLGDRSVMQEDWPLSRAGEIIEAYTQALRETTGGMSKLGADRFDVTAATLPIPMFRNGTNRQRDDIDAEALIDSLRGLPEAFGKNVSRSKMIAAAISILLGEESPADPVSGKAFAWDPETRTLSAPGREDMLPPLVLPRQD